MRTICKALAVCLLMTGACLAQTDDPFGGSAADPFAPNPARSAVQKPAKEAEARQRAVARNEAVPGKVLPKRNASDATIRINAALSDETSQSFIDVPLEEAVSQLSMTHDIPIVIDRRALEEIGLTIDNPVSLSLKNVSLRSFLRLMLRDLDLTYMVKDEVMQITTVEAAEQNLVMEMYQFPEQLTEKSDKVVKALTASVVPAAWEELGGPCSVSVIDNVLVVSATSDIHDRVNGFLEKLQAAFEKHKSAK